MQSRAEIHAERLAWQLDSWRSLEVACVETISPNKPDSSAHAVFNEIESLYIETGAGQRLLDCRYLKSGSERSRAVHYFDGRRGADVLYRKDKPGQQDQATFHRHFYLEADWAQSSRPLPLSYYWVARRPIHKVLSNATHLGERKVMGRDCDVFLFRNAGWSGVQEQVYCLDNETSVPLEIDVFSNDADRIAGRPLTAWSAKEVTEFQGHPFVRESTQKDYTGEGRALSFSREYHVKSMVYNREYPPSTFWPTLQANVVVFDTISNKAPYRAAEEIHGRGEVNGQQPSRTAEPIRADLPSQWGDSARCELWVRASHPDLRPFSSVAFEALTSLAPGTGRIRAGPESMRTMKSIAGLCGDSKNYEWIYAFPADPLGGGGAASYHPLRS